MKIILISNSKENDPGLRITKNTKKEFLEIYKDKIRKESALQLMISGTLVSSVFDYLFQKDNELYTIKLNTENTSKNNDPWSIITLNAAIISKETIIDSSIKYNDKLFKGIFKSERHFNEIVKSLPSFDSEIYICDPHTIKQINPHELLPVGIYVMGSGKIIPSRNYSDQMWSHVREGILGAFGNLNVKKIHLIDTTSSSAKSNINADLKNLSADIGLNFERKSSYEIISELNGTLDTLKAEQYLSQLDHTPSLKILAKQMIDNPNHLKSIKHNLILDISFGMDIDLLTRLQGSFEGGYNRTFKLEMEF